MGAICCGASMSLYALLVLRNDTHLQEGEDTENLLDGSKQRSDSQGKFLRYIKVSTQWNAADEDTVTE